MESLDIVVANSLDSKRKINCYSLTNENMEYTIADTDRVARQTKLVMSTVGPFAKYGTPLGREDSLWRSPRVVRIFIEYVTTHLVISCARYGTHYVDITGEIGWVRHVIENLDKTARLRAAGSFLVVYRMIWRTTGARIVPCCGQDSVPWWEMFDCFHSHFICCRDIVTFAAAEAFGKRVPCSF